MIFLFKVTLLKTPKWTAVSSPLGPIQVSIHPGCGSFTDDITKQQEAADCKHNFVDLPFEFIAFSVEI